LSRPFKTFFCLHYDENGAKLVSFKNEKPFSPAL